MPPSAPSCPTEQTSRRTERLYTRPNSIAHKYVLGDLVGLQANLPFRKQAVVQALHNVMIEKQSVWLFPEADVGDWPVLGSSGCGTCAIAPTRLRSGTRRVGRPPSSHGSMKHRRSLILKLARLLCHQVLHATSAMTTHTGLFGAWGQVDRRGSSVAHWKLLQGLWSAQWRSGRTACYGRC